MARPTTAQLSQIEAELPAIWKRLVAHAVRIMNSKRWIRGGTPPHGKQPSDLLNESLEKVLSSERRWNPTISLEDAIVGTMKSLAWGWATGLANREAGIDGLQADARLSADDQRPASATPEAECLSRECFARLADMAMNATAGDPEAEKLVTAVLDGHEKPQDVAAATGLTTAQIFNAKKRLHRKLADLSVAEEAKP